MKLDLPSINVLGVTEGPVAPSNANLGQVILILAAVAVLVWVAYLVIASRRGSTPTPEATPKNLQPYVSDDELENHRLNRVLGAAVIASAVLAVSLPVYYVSESRRQAEAAEAFHEKDVEEGHRWYTELFLCADCHGPDGGGGGADFIEARSGLSTSWAAPPINDIFYRYSDEETEYWLNYGRTGTPMPVAGLIGGGAGTVQEIDQLMAYLRSIEISQDAVLSTIETQVSQALNRLSTADATVAQLAREQQAVIDDIYDAEEQFAAIEALPSRLEALMADDFTCTSKSAAAVGSTCRQAGTDSDRDGLTDELETILAGEGNAFASVVDETVLVRDVANSDAPIEITPGGRVAYESSPVRNGDLPHLYGLTLDPDDAFTMEDASGEPMPDLEAVESFLGDLDNAHLNLSVTSSRAEVFLDSATTGLDFLLDAAQTRAWVVDFDQVAADTGLSLGDAERAVGLFNAYCARCHTAGYAAGVAFQRDAGSGAWAPALDGGRSVVQFPSEEDQVSFIIKGSNEAETYGVNGFGRGWMPGFGRILSEADIRLIVAYERSL